MSRHTHTHTHTHVHSIMIHNPNRWEQPKCPPTNEWISKAWHFPTVEYYSVIKRDDVLTCATTRMSLENTVSERRDTHTHTHTHTRVV